MFVFWRAALGYEVEHADPNGGFVILRGTASRPGRRVVRPRALGGSCRDRGEASCAFPIAAPAPDRSTSWDLAVWIADSLLLVGSTIGREPMRAFLYVWVEDADAVYGRALDRGAASLEEPRDSPYGDRMIRDPGGNTWQIATHGGRFTP